MKLFRTLLAATCLLAACSSQPEPLSLEEAPAALRKAFATAQSFTKKTAETIAGQITNSQYGPASIQLQALLANTALTKEQRSVASRAMVAVGAKLQETAATEVPAEAATSETAAPATPPEKAAEAAAIQDHYIRTK